MKSSTKSKIQYHKANLSAFVVANLIRSINSDIALSKHAKPQEDKTEIMNLELKLNSGAFNIYGEVSICDYVVQNKNLSLANNEQLKSTSSDDLKFSHWVHVLNTGIRASANKFAVLKDQSAKDAIKVQVKEIEEHLMNHLIEGDRFGNSGLLHAMFFSYIEPVSKLTNKKVQVALKKVQEKLNFMSFDEFTKDASGIKKASKDVSVSNSQAKLVRVANGQVLPIEGKRNILITSALPYVNNVPHLGNIIGCVLSGDVYARFARLMGHNAIYVCGTDEYGTATVTKAMKENKTPQEICDHYHALHKEIYQWFDCDFDIFGRTTTPKQTEITQDIFNKLKDAGNTSEKVTDQQFCESCDLFLADRFVGGECNMCHFPDAGGDQCDGCGKLINAVELINPKCKICGAKPVIRQSKHLFINLPKITPELTEWVESVKSNWSSNAVAFTDTLLKGGLIERCITRDLKWGTKVPLEEYADKVFYVWFDAPIGYISITGNYTDKWEQWWKNPENIELYQFMGKDNITFHTVIFPSTLIGTNENWTKLKQISTTEYLNYEIDPATGKPKKFSKRNSVGVFGDDAKKTGIPSEVWRYYLLVNRPEQQDSTFLWSDFVAKNNNELLANLGNFSNRCLKFLSSSFSGVVPKYDGDLNEADASFLKQLKAIFEKFIELLEAVKIKDGIKVAMEFSAACNVYFQENKPWELAKSDKNRCSQVMNTAIQALYLLCVILEPYMPSFSAKVYEQMNIKRTQEHETMILFVSQDFDSRVRTLVKGEHTIGTPQPIFKEIPLEEAENWKSRFGGN